jgi:PAS domain S-box
MLAAFDALNLNYFIMEIIYQNGTPVDGIYREVSPSTAKLIGKRREDIIGKSRRELFGNITNEVIIKFHQVIKTGQPLHFQSLGILNRYYDVYAWKAAGKQVAVIVVDITENKKVEEALRESEHQFVALVKASSNVVYRMNADWSVMCQLQGNDFIPDTREPNKKWLEKYIPPEDIQTVSEAINQAINTKSVFELEHQVIQVDGSVGWTHSRAIPLLDKNGKIVEWLGMASDITERKRAQEALKRSAEQSRQRAEELQKLMDIIPAAIWISNDAQCKNIVGNNAANHFYEAEEGENVSAGPTSGSEQDTTRRFFRDGKELLPQELPMQEAAAKNIEIKNIELDVLRPSGRKTTMLGSAKPLLGGDGKVRGCLGAFVDISERKKAEEEIERRTSQLELTRKNLEKKAAEVEEYAARMEELVKERTEKLEKVANYARNLIEASLDPLVTISADGKITDVNRATEKVTERSREELIGSNFSDYFTEPEKAEAGYKKVFTEGSVTDYPLAIRAKSGYVTEVLYNAATYSDEHGKIQGVFAAARDVTERRKAEREAKENARKLKEAERLAAIGATAGMVGHDIRNPLQSIVGDVFLAKAELEGLPDSRVKREVLESLNQTESNVDYINKIVQDLQDYARPLNPRADENDLQAVFEHAVRQSKVPQNIKTHIEVDMQARSIKTDTYYLNRILYNLITNSVQAMPNGGQLTIQAYREDKDIVVAVKDTGVGIPEDVQAKMFAVMFTTKSKGQGFGLPVVKRMTESLGGTVSFTSEEGKGTMFTVRLPAKA